MSNTVANFYIVTPSYNQAQYLRETIDSVLLQQSEMIQISYIVMDGNSTDESVKILKSYGEKLNWKSEKDKGQTDAINKGLLSFLRRQESMHDSLPSMQPLRHENDIQKSLHIFAYINSDDYYVPNAFKTVVNAFESNPKSTWVVGDAVIVDEKGRQIQKPIRLYKYLFRYFLQFGVLHILNPIPQPSTFIKMEAILEMGTFNPDLRYTMDYEYWLRLKKRYGSPVLIPQVLSSFRIHGQSKGGSQFQQQFREELAVAKHFTSNPLLISLHSLHNQLIQFIYQYLK